jgi:hypothetical protein
MIGQGTGATGQFAVAADEGGAQSSFSPARVFC